MAEKLLPSLATLAPRLRFNYSKPNIENFIFKLHYKVTVTFLLAFIITICAKDYFQSNIQCITGDSTLPSKVVESYCFFMGVFTISHLPMGVEAREEGPQQAFHNYYQWVPFVLLFQAICFYAPHHLWKKHEGGRIKTLVEGLQNARMALEDEDQKFGGKLIPSKSSVEKKIETIKKEIISRLLVTSSWSAWLVAMEIANLVNVIFQIWLTNKFLRGFFLSLGIKVMQFNDLNNKTIDPLEHIFPKVTRCMFYKYGPSGSLQNRDSICIMSLNIFHEKIYLGLWFWFLFLFIMSTLGVMWRVASFFLYRRSARLTAIVFRKVSRSRRLQLASIAHTCRYGDWLFLHYLAKNMHGFVFSKILDGIAVDFENRESPFNQDYNRKQSSTPFLCDKLNYDKATNNHFGN